MEAQELTEILNGFLASLPETERRVFLCRYWYFDSIRDIASRFGFTQSKVKVMLMRTRDKLRLRLKKEGILVNSALLQDAMGEIRDDYIFDAHREDFRSARRHRAVSWRRSVALIAALMLVVMAAIPAMAAADFAPAYDLLYDISPKAAQTLKPVYQSCEDKGIQLEVISASVTGDELQAYIAVQDLDRDRIDETTDLFEQQLFHPHRSIKSNKSHSPRTVRVWQSFYLGAHLFQHSPNLTLITGYHKTKLGGGHAYIRSPIVDSPRHLTACKSLGLQAVTSGP